MHKSQYPKTILFITALLFILGACAPAAANIEVLPEAAVAAAETSAFTPVKFIDTVGHEIVIEAPPARIVSLAPSITESLYAIGAGDLLVGRTEYCDYPEEALALPTVGEFSSSTISVEAIVALEPDLVIGGSIYQADLVETLENAGIQVFIMDPLSIEDTLTALKTLGAITEHAAEADALVTEMQARIGAVAQVVDTIPLEQRVTVFYEVWHDPYMTTSGHTFIGELISMAGGLNIFADLEEDYPAISSEEIIDKDPLVILGPSNHADQLTVEVIAGREGWENLSAVKSARIAIIDGNIISRAGPRVVDALEAIAQALYPDKFGG